MPRDLKCYRVFIASPGGLETERRAFRDRLEHYNQSEAIHRGAVFEPVGWEVTLGGVGRPQSMINEEIMMCDYFVLVLSDRWGSSPDPKGHEGKYTSATHEEYELAMQCYGDLGKPMRQVVGLFETLSPERMSDPGEQLKQVIEFQKSLDHEKTIFYQRFDSLDRFKDLVTAYLGQWLRDHNDGHGGEKTDPPPKTGPTAPGLEQPATDALAEPPQVRVTYPISQEVTDLVEHAEQKANDGLITEAETLYASAIVRSQAPAVINSYGLFLMRLGNLDQSIAMFERIVEVTRDGDSDEEQEWQSIALGNLGLIYQTRGDLDSAEEMHRKSLAISESLGRKEGMASEYCNLGVIYLTRGDLDSAEEMLRKSLAMNEELGRKEGMAIQYGNLGLIYQTRGDLDTAEEVHRKSLAIEESLGRKEGMAGQYGNLGLIYLTREELDSAEEMFRKSLAMNEELGRKEGMASVYGNLGLIYQTRGDLDGAEEMHRKSLAISESLGRKEGMASQYGNLGVIYKTRGDLDTAEEMHRKSLAIEESLGRKEGMANQYGNLGVLAEKRGDAEEARSCWQRSLALCQEVGIGPKIEKIQSLLDDLDAGTDPESPEEG